MLKVLGFLFFALLILVLIKFKTLQRLHKVITLFDKENIVENFMNMEQFIETKTIAKSPNPSTLDKAWSYDFPEDFVFEGKTMNTKKYLDETLTTGLMIIHKDSVIHESYHLGNTPSTTHIVWSISKSFVSALVGIALEDGLFDSVEDPITKYLPQLKETAYNGVTIKNILQMSTGIKFDEDYSNFNSDINRFGRFFALGKSFEKFIFSLEKELDPKKAEGIYHHYISLNTQVLGMLVAKVSDQPLADYLKEKIWDPMGMEFDAHWIIDKTQMEMALGGLNVCLRDLGRFGQLFLHRGNYQGKQILTEDWIDASLKMDAPHLLPGDHGASHDTFGYGYQWWFPEKPEGDFFASGIYNQYIYIHPEKELVIVKTSANYHFKEPNNKSKNEHVALFKKMAEQF